MKRLFGTDGVRGRANTELSPELSFKVGKYAAYVLTKHKTDGRPLSIVIGKDTRQSGDMIEAAIIAGVLSIGAKAISLGVIPTPAIPHLIFHHQADLGIMISASHNPAEFNGIKIFDAEGLKLGDEIEEEIEEMIHNEATLSGLEISSTKVGRHLDDAEAVDVYAEKMIHSLKYDLKGLNIGLDCANGSNYHIGPKVLRRLGAEVHTIGVEPDGLNINDNCGSTHLDQLRKLVLEKKLHVGLAFDGDADRLLALDENGDLIDGDRIMLGLAKKMKAENRLNNNKVVVTVMSNMGLFKALEAEGIETEKTQVGDRYVLENMLKNNHSIGGEQSGHVILRDFNNTGDGLYTALRFLELLENGSRKASEFTAAMKSYPQFLKNVIVPNHLKYELADLADVKTKIKEVEDGLQGRGRVLLRASGTEPLVRVMLEGEDEAEIEKYTDELVAYIEEMMRATKQA